MVKFTFTLCVLICVGFGVVVAQEYQAGNVRLAKSCEFVSVKTGDARGHHWLCK